MSYIIYYSNICEVSKKLLKILSKTNNEGIHFLCIDNRVKTPKGTFIVLKNNQQIIMPPNITRVPALMVISEGGRAIFGVDDILNFLKPKLHLQVSQATNNNMEPIAFGFGNFNNGISSDRFGFLDQTSDEMSAVGNGGIRQMHNYASFDDTQPLSEVPQLSNPTGKIKDGEIDMEALTRKRNEDLSKYIPKPNMF